jgi:two-component system, OmpR family, phosphate regulon sensor histidine kinase PhoR
VKRNTLRLLVILATLCIIGISVTQVYWVRRAFDLKQEALHREINTALFNVAHHIFKINKLAPPDHNPVRQLSTNYFVVTVNSEVDVKLLEFLLKSEFEKRHIAFDFEYGIYNCDNEKMVYGNYIPIETKSKEQRGNLPVWKDQTYYFGVQFPTIESHPLNQMGIWSFSTLVMLLVIVFFAYSLFVIFKQRRLSEIQKDFINNMTHEFKTPISTIAISAEVLKNPDTAQHPERLLNYATIIQNENSRLRQQVDRVLQVARLDKETVNLKWEALNLESIVREAVHNFELALKEKNAIIRINSTAANLNVAGDKLHIINVLNNLLDNALKYVERQPDIQIMLVNTTCPMPSKSLFQFKKRNIPAVSVTIIDNGIGITPENQKRIFQQFYRVPTGNVHNVKGFGIGLHYVKLIAEAHGGLVSVKSQLGAGSTFIITLPLA